MTTVEDRGPAGRIRRVRSELLSVPAARMGAAGLRDALRELYEDELGGLAARAGVGRGSGYALLACGGLGRGEVMPYSDLDLVLVHERRPGRGLNAVADALWYPLWDSGVNLDHSVRTVAQCLSVAADDVSVALALLDARMIAGDADLGALVVGGARRQWRVQIPSRFDDLVIETAARRSRAGVIAHRAEADLKNGAGGLRDVQLLSALSLAHLTDGRSAVPGDDLTAAHRLVLDARTELHRACGRGREVMHAEYGGEVGRALGLGDRFDLARALSSASRTIAFAADQAIRDSCGVLASREMTGPFRRSPLRRPLDDDVVAHAGEVALARGADVSEDAWLPMRVAAAAARHRLPVAGSTLGVLVERSPIPRGSWPPEALANLLVVLGSGDAQVPVIEALDRSGLWERFLPEWSAVRDLPARDRAHVHTVDRHLVQTAVEASRLTTALGRPDLLLVSALAHDLGKGRGGDHSVEGAGIARGLGERLGLATDDVDTVVRVVRHHLLLAATAARRDPADPDTADDVLTTLNHDCVALDVLGLLTEADSRATGPSVWTKGRERAVADLVAACRSRAAGPSIGVVAPSLVATRPHGAPDVVVVLRSRSSGATHDLTLVAPGDVRSLAVTAEVLAAHGLGVIEAEVDLRPPGGVRATMDVAPDFGDPVDPRVLRQDLRRSIDRGLPNSLRVALERSRAAAPEYAQAPPSVLIGPRDDGEGALLRVRTEDRPGLLARVVRAVAESGERLDWMVVRTRGTAVEDVLALSGPGGGQRADVAADVEALLPRREPAMPSGGRADTL